MKPSRVISAYSKATHSLSTKMMHGNTYTRTEGEQRILHIQTHRNDDEIIKMAKEECEKLGLELWKVDVIGSKATSFNTRATWSEQELFRDDSKAEYYEGCFDGKGNRIE